MAPPRLNLTKPAAISSPKDAVKLAMDQMKGDQWTGSMRIKRT